MQRIDTPLGCLVNQTILGLLLAGLVSPAFAINGFYAGVGASGNSINENYNSNFYSSTNKSARDTYNVSANQLAPMLQVGYVRSPSPNWLWGVVAQWKYLNYQTANVDSENGQHLPNASFSSINFFGKDIVRDFASQTQITNEFLLLAYFGLQLMQGYGYLGLGPVLLTASNHVYLNSVHTPNGTGDNLISTSVDSNQTMWGGAAQVGYDYFFNSSVFININYTYLQTVPVSFKNTINAAVFNGAGTPNATSLTLNRNINVSTQEVMISINKVF